MLMQVAALRKHYEAEHFDQMRAWNKKRLDDWNAIQQRKLDAKNRRKLLSKQKMGIRFMLIFFHERYLILADSYSYRTSCTSNCSVNTSVYCAEKTKVDENNT